MKHTSTKDNCAAEILLLSLPKQKMVIKLAMELHSVCKIQTNLVLVLQLRAKYCLVFCKSSLPGREIPTLRNGHQQQQVQSNLVMV